MRDCGETPGGTSWRRHLVNLEVARERVVPQPVLLVLFLVVVPGEAPEVHGGREEAVHAPQQVILGPEEGPLICWASRLPSKAAALPGCP